MLRDIRISHGITMQALAEEAKLSRFTISSAEQELPISAVSANKIANALSRLSGQAYTVESLKIKISSLGPWKTSKIDGTEDDN